MNAKVIKIFLWLKSQSKNIEEHLCLRTHYVNDVDCIENLIKYKFHNEPDSSSMIQTISQKY